MAGAFINLSPMKYLKNIWLTLIKMMFSIKGWVLLGISQLASVGHVKIGAWILLFVFIVDFITGTIASFSEKIRSGNKVSIYDFKSAKVRLSFVKAITYIFFILMSWMFYLYMFDKPFPMPGSSQKYTIPEIAIGLCISVEVWSNFENFKRFGFDLFGSLLKMASKIQIGAMKIWNLISVLKTGRPMPPHDHGDNQL